MTLLVWTVLGAMALSSNAATLQDMDNVLLKAGGLNEFLANPQLIDEYFKIASEYYADNDRFQRISYDAIINQIKVVVKAYPELAARAWETNLGKPFQVASVAATYGRNLNDSAWDLYLKQYKEKLHEQAGEFAKLSDDEAREEFRKGVESLQKKINDHELEMKDSPLKKSEKQALIGKFYQSLKTDKELQKLSSFVLLKWLASDKAGEMFKSANSDLILNYLKDMKDQPKKVLAYVPGTEDADALVSIVKAGIPDPNTLLNNEKLFPRKMIPGKDEKMIPVEAGSTGHWDFVPSPRRFHAFFKGVYFGECVGGSCKKDFLPSLSPERWATIILKDTEFHFVQKDGKFQGWVQAVPITQNGNVYASVDFAAHSFRQSIISRDANGALFSESMLSGWLKQAMQNKPENWHGYIVGSSNAINNGGALPTVRMSPAYLLGHKYDVQTHPFAHGDPATVQKLTNIIPRVGYAKNYGGSMIFDASVPDAGDLTELKVIEKSVYQVIKNAIDSNQSDIVKALLARVHSSAMSDLGNEVLTLRGAGVLKLLSDRGFKLPNNVVYYTTDPMKYINTLIKAGLSMEEMKYAQNLICHDVTTTINFSNELLTSSLVTDFEAALTAVDYEVKTPSEAYVNEMEKYLKNVIPFLAKKYPNMTVDQWIKVENRTRTIESGSLALKTAFPYIATADDFLKLFDNAYQRGNDNYKKHIGALIGANLTIFFSKSPTDELATKLVNQFGNYWSKEQNVFFHLKSGWAEKVKNRIASAQTKEDLIKELTSHKSVSGELRNTAGKITGENTARLLKLDPSYEELEKVINDGVHYEDSFVELLRAQASKATTFEQFKNVFEKRAHWTKDSYLKSRHQILLQNIERIKNFPDFVSKPELAMQLSKSVPKTNAWIEDLLGKKFEATLAGTNDPKVWTDLLSKHVKVSSESYRERVSNYARDNYKFFLGTNPSEKQLNWYKDTFYRFHERLTLRFTKPVTREIAPEAPFCTKVF